MVTKRKIGKTTVYPLFSLSIQFSAIEIRYVFSHGYDKLIATTGKNGGVPMFTVNNESLVSYSHFSTDRAQY